MLNYPLMELEKNGIDIPWPIRVQIGGMHMIREYLEQNVYEALQNRLMLIFEEFDNIYISFSGGKDSGLLLNLVLDYQKKHYPNRKIGVFHQDFEAQYTVTTEYVERTFERIKDDVEPYWVCLPMATRTALGSYEMYWYPWDDKKQEAWVRPMPQKDYVIHLGNNPMTTYRYRMHQEDLAKQFGRWYRMSHGNKKTICLLGMRARTNPFSVTAAFSISVTVIRANAGSAASLRTCGVPRLYMTGHRLIYGMPTIYLDMIITICMIFTTRPDLRFHRCVWHPHLTIILVMH